MFCKNCGNQIDNNFKVCPYCGTPCERKDIANALSSFRPDNTPNNKRKKSAVVACVIIAVFAVFSILLVLVSNTPSDEISTSTTSEPQSIQYILVQKGYSEKQATEIETILRDLGINSIEIQSMSGIPQDGLNAVVCYPNGSKKDKSRFTFTTENGKLFYVGFLDEDLYDSENGGIIKRYDEVHIPESDIGNEEKLYLMTAAEDTIKLFLSYPSTADFHSLSWQFAREDNKYSASGSVSAQNAFGVEEELPFTVYFEEKNGKIDVVAVNLNGQRVYDK